MQWYFLLLSLFICHFISAQELQFKIRVLSEEDKLNTNFHADILEDKHGFLWLGGNGGLIRHNGSHSTMFQTEDGLQSNHVYKLYDDPDSLLWIQHYSKNIDILNPLTNDIQSFEEHFGAILPFKSNQITYLFIAQDKTIYVKIQTGTYYKYSGKKRWKKIWHSTSDMSTFVQYVSQNQQGHSWIHEKDSCYWVNKDNSVVHRHFIGDSVWILGEYQQDLILYKYETKGIQFYQLSPNSPLKKLTTSINSHEIQNINTLVNHADKSLHQWNKHHYLFYFSHYQRNYLFKQKAIPSFLSYQENINSKIKLKDGYRLKVSNNKDRLISFGAQPSIIHISYNYFQHHAPRTEDQPHSTRAIVVDPKKNLYVQSYDQEYPFWKKTDNASLIKALPLVLNSSGLSSILSKDKQTLIMGMENASVVTYNTITEETKTYYNCDGVLPVFLLWAFWAVHEDSNNQIWIGSRDGIYLLDSIKQCIVPFEQYNEYTLFAKSIVWEFYENEKGLWAATNSGLYLIDKSEGVIAHYHSKASAPFRIPSDNISFVYEDSLKNFWLGTQGDGLIKLNLKTGLTKQWTTDSGLSNNRVHSIYPDDYHHLWMSSDNGLMQMNLKHNSFITFLPEEGLPHHEFNRKSHYKDNEGYLYFGGLQGLVKFHPKDFNRPYTPKETPFRLTKCTKWNKKSNKEQNITKEVLKSRQIDFYTDDVFLNIEYALIDFKDPDNHKYTYKIDGYSDNWVITNKHNIQLSGLPPGDYTLIIKARANFSEWHKNKLILKIKVHTPFYKTYWFIGLCIFIIISWIIFYYRLRIRRLDIQKEQLEKAVKKRTLQVEKDKTIIEKQANDLKRLDELKNNFFVNISHELRTPLTLITTPLQYLLEESILQKKHNKQQFQTLKIALQNSQKLQTLVDEILLLSKLEAHKLTLQYSAIRLLPFLEQIYASFETKALTQGNIYEFETDEHIDICISIDWKKLERILYNLLSNAFKFAPTQKIIFSIKLEAENYLNITVKDFGQGIHPNDIEQVFDRYYQSKHNSQLEQGGTGIGLALSKEFSKLLGGTLEVKSTLNKGSTFQLRIPVVLSKNENAQQLFYFNKDIVPTETSASFSSPLQKEQSTILVVEDNDQLRAFMQQFLSKQFNVVTAVDGLNAWDILNEEDEKIDLIISDIMMPRLDGYQLSKKLKTSKKWASVPLIILSARTTQKDKLTALRIGVDDYLIKPFNTQELIIRVRNLLNNYLLKKAALLELSDSSKNKTKEADQDDLDMVWLEKVETLAIQKIEKESGNFNVAVLAEELGISDRQLRRKLKLLVGISPNQYLRELKLILAKKYLEEQKFTSVSKVATAVGFNTPSHFVKLYLKRFGKTPSNYFL